MKMTKRQSLMCTLGVIGLFAVNGSYTRLWHSITNAASAASTSHPACWISDKEANSDAVSSMGGVHLLKHLLEEGFTDLQPVDETNTDDPIYRDASRPCEATTYEQVDLTNAAGAVRRYEVRVTLVRKEGEIVVARVQIGNKVWAE